MFLSSAEAASPRLTALHNVLNLDTFLLQKIDEYGRVVVGADVAKNFDVVRAAEEAGTRDRLSADHTAGLALLEVIIVAGTVRE